MKIWDWNLKANCQIFDGNGHDIFLDDPSKRIFTNGEIKSIKIGNNCWIGISSIILPGSKLGNNCIVEAGLYLTAGTKLRFFKDDEIQEIKAADLSGMSDILFRRNSITGVVEAISNSKDTSLNPELHKN